jgi:hypothetical protein
MNEITKIDRATGNIIWRLGLHAAHNDFTFVNDARGFSHQHDIRRLPNKNITLFDNGNFLNPEFSRAVEYKLNENSHRATLVWKYEASPPIWGGFMGNVQRLPSGNTMVGWGGTSVPPGVTELHTDATQAYALGFSSLWYTYRAFRFPWRTNALLTSSQSLDFGRVVIGGSRTMPMTVRNNTNRSLTITEIATSDSVFSSATPVPITLAPGQTAPYSATFTPPASGTFSGNLYLRCTTANEVLAQVVALTGVADISSATPASQAFVTHLEPPMAQRSGTVEVRFAIGSAPADVRLEIFDVRGQRVRLLDQSTRIPGTYRIPWDRRDDQAVRVSRGVYFVQMTAGSYQASKKLVLWR